MELAVITAEQVLRLLLMILIGAVCCKWGVFQPKEKSVLANLLLYVVSPAMILDSYMVDFDPAIFHNLLVTFALSTVALVVGMVVAFADGGTLGRVAREQVELFRTAYPER